jgi:hypothetical protein
MILKLCDSEPLHLQSYSYLQYVVYGVYIRLRHVLIYVIWSDLGQVEHMKCYM